MTAAPPDLDFSTKLVRTSERKDFKRCPWLWHESWIKGLAPVQTPTWSWFGTAIHRGLEVRYQPGAKRGKRKAVKEAFEESLENETRRVYTAGDEIDPDKIVDARELGFAMLDGYIDHYGPEKDIYVVHSEQSFQIDVPDPIDPTRTLCVYAGTWDSLWYIDGVYWLVDHKTRKSFKSDYTFYDIDDQAGSYLWVAPQVLEHMGILTKKETKKIMGLQFNLLRKALPTTKTLDPYGKARNKPQKIHYEEALSPVMDLPARLPAIAVLEEYARQRGITVYGEVSAVQPSPLFERYVCERTLQERVKQGQRVQAETKWMESILNGTMPLFKTPNEDCVRCQFLDYCAADEHDYDEGQELAQVILAPRDKYADHHEAMKRGGVVLERK